MPERKLGSFPATPLEEQVAQILKETGFMEDGFTPPTYPGRLNRLNSIIEQRLIIAGGIIGTVAGGTGAFMWLEGLSESQNALAATVGWGIRLVSVLLGGLGGATMGGYGGLLAASAINAVRSKFA